MNIEENDKQNALALHIHKFLGEAVGDKKLALRMGMSFADPITQEALNRCTFNGWLTLIDIIPVDGQEGLFRIFALTNAGMKQLQAIEEFLTNHDKKAN